MGNAGEKYVYDYEFNKLSKCGRADLAIKIVKQHEDLSYFPGYDIQSFDDIDGEKIFIEVKSSKSKKKGYFEKVGKRRGTFRKFQEGFENLAKNGYFEKLVRKKGYFVK